MEFHGVSSANTKETPPPPRETTGEGERSLYPTVSAATGKTSSQYGTQLFHASPLIFCFDVGVAVVAENTGISRHLLHPRGWQEKQRHNMTRYDT